MENKEQEIDLLNLFKVLWLERKKIIKYGIVGAVFGLIIAFSIPKVYETTVKIAPESNTNQNAMSGLSEMTGISLGDNKNVDGISSQIYPEIIKSTPFILEFANIKVRKDDHEMSFFEYITENQDVPWWNYITGLPFKAINAVASIFKDSSESGEAKGINIFNPSQKQLSYVKSLRGLITINSDKRQGPITIIVKMQDPYIAAIISDSLLANLQRYMIDYKTSKTRADLKSNESKLNEARTKYYYADSLYAVSVDRNQSLITQEARIKLERLSNEKLLAFTIYQQIASKVESNRIDLQANTPIATIIEPASVAISASSPQKAVILIVFTFLFCFFIACRIIIKELMKKNEQ